MFFTVFWCLFVVLLVFLALLRNRCYSFHRTKWRLNLRGRRKKERGGRKARSLFSFFLIPYPSRRLLRRLWRLVTSIWHGPGPVTTRIPFFSLKFKSAANFSAPAQEGNLLFLSGRSDRKKIHNFPIKSSHLCWTSRHVWLLSSACDHCCAYQLICNYGN